MASHHESIRVGDAEIVGEQGDVIQWKLDGQGLKEYVPVYEGYFNLVDSSMPATPVHVKIFAFGKIRIIHVDEVTVQLIATPSTGCSILTAIPLAHRPSQSTQFYGTFITSTNWVRPVVYTLNLGNGNLDLATYGYENRIVFPAIGTSNHFFSLTDMYTVQ